MRRTPKPQASAAVRQPLLSSTTNGAAAAAPAATTIAGASQPRSPAELPITISSVTAPAAIAAAPRTRPPTPSRRAWAKVAPTRAALNGASSET